MRRSTILLFMVMFILSLFSLELKEENQKIITGRQQVYFQEDHYTLYNSVEEGNLVKVLKRTLSYDMKQDTERVLFSKVKKGESRLSIIKTNSTIQGYTFSMGDSTELVLYNNIKDKYTTNYFPKKYRILYSDSLSTLIYDTESKSIKQINLQENQIIQEIKDFDQFTFTKSKLLVWERKGFFPLMSNELCIYDTHLKKIGEVKGFQAMKFNHLYGVTNQIPIISVENDQYITMSCLKKFWFLYKMSLISLDIRQPSTKVCYYQSNSYLPYIRNKAECHLLELNEDQLYLFSTKLLKNEKNPFEYILLKIDLNDTKRKKPEVILSNEYISKLYISSEKIILMSGMEEKELLVLDTKTNKVTNRVKIDKNFSKDLYLEYARLDGENISGFFKKVIDNDDPNKVLVQNIFFNVPLTGE